MPKWDVLVPIAGYAVVRVEAGSEKEAIDNAFLEGVSYEDFETWDAYEHIVDGHVFCAEENDARAIRIDEDEEEES